MDWALVLAVVAIVVSVLLTYWRTLGGKKQRLILEQQLLHQQDELEVLRQLVESFNRLTESYDRELDSMRTQLQLTAGEPPGPGDQAEVAREVELEKERQKAEKKRQKSEAKLIKKHMKALEKAAKD